MSTSYRIPFNRPWLSGKELAYMADVIQRGHAAGDGHYSKRCEELIAGMSGSSRVLLTTSCTHALEMAALLLEIGPGDEVILPSFTFVSTANAFALRGATLVFCDVRPDTLNIDERKIPSLITDRTKAIVVVHYGGVGCEMKEIVACANEKGIALVEDNAHGFAGKYRGKPLGSFGAFATLSFHETKNISCGEGGALLVNDPRYVSRAEIIREKGTNRSQFFRGEIDKYTWVDVGSSYVPSDLLAGFLLAQLESCETIQKKRNTIWDRYREALEPWAETRGVKMPTVPTHCEQAYHLFYLIMPDEACRSTLIDRLKEQGILSVFHYVPLHLSPMASLSPCRAGDLAVTEDMASRIVRLPFYNGLEHEQQETVIAAVTDCR